MVCGEEQADWYMLNNYRFEELKNLLAMCGPAQVLIWANYRKEFEIIRDMLGDKCKTIYGATSLSDKNKAIQEFKARQIVCPMCGAQILDVASALNDRKTGKPVHFECAMESVSKNETLGENEKIAYIGQGRFGVLYFENPRDQRKFTIKKIIEWEDREAKSEWREEMSNLYSQIQ